MEKFISAFQDSVYAIIPLLIIVIILQFFVLKLSKRHFLKILYALFLTFIGLTLFLFGVDISFVKVGKEIGMALGMIDKKWVVVMIGFVLGIVITLAEPAVKILNEEIEEVTFGYINKKLILFFISVGVAFSIALSIIRIYTGIPLLYFIIPGYLVVFILSKFTNPLFLAMAIDAGGVVTGPMIASVLLSIMVSMSGVIETSNPLLDGFGLIALVALMPMISIMILGLIYEIKNKGGTNNGE
ncbi:MAG: DUF1538 domain-containing protein [Bacilli bacterium]|nr:DUF1538 domain-containing protein [Bacilli bacterium]MDD4608333.1 DUF1538 domain-containing protein [Bacilli bacterium]